MNKEKFLAALRRRLRVLPVDEVERILAYYREMIDDKVESGWTEEDAVKEYGSVSALAQKILAENPNRRPRNVGKIVAITLASVIVVACIASGFLAYNAKRNVTSWGFHSGVSAHYTYKKYDSAAKDIGMMSVSAEDKAVVFTPWERDHIEVTYPTNEDQTYDIKSTADGLTIVNHDRYGRENKWEWDNSEAPTITVMVPKNFAGDVKVNTTNSYVNLSNFSKMKDVACTTTNSAISIENLTAHDLSFQTQNAAINLKNVSAAGKIAAFTQNAQIGLKEISAPDITLQTQNALITGTVLGREDEYTIDARTTNAISNLKSRSGGSKKLSVETTNAIISVDFKK